VLLLAFPIPFILIGGGGFGDVAPIHRFSERNGYLASGSPRDEQRLPGQLLLDILIAASPRW